MGSTLVMLTKLTLSRFLVSSVSVFAVKLDKTDDFFDFSQFCQQLGEMK